MSFEPEGLLGNLEQLATLAGTPARFVVAFSGGLDSTVLLHVLGESRDRHGIPLVAVHVDHGLHRESQAWARRCEAFAAAAGIEFAGVRVDVAADGGFGVEAAAREARYGALRGVLRGGDWLLSAHHKDDQAETLLLNLMRGSGPAGLAGIAEVRPFASGWLLRPMLAYTRSELEAYATENGLSWIDDPSNEDRQFDRNYLRHDVMPLLEARWPDVANRLRRSAALAGEAAQMLDQLADADARRLGTRPDRLSLAGLRELPAERQRNVLRYVVRELGLAAPPAGRLHSIVDDLVTARDDAQPLVTWPGVEIRRYRDGVYVLPAMQDPPPPRTLPAMNAGTPLRVPLPVGLGDLCLEPDAAEGLSDAVLAKGLELRFRHGGESIKPFARAHTRKLKKLLQEEGIVPWMRDRLPLLFAGGDLVAVADLCIADDATSRPGTALHWQNRPPLH